MTRPTDQQLASLIVRQNLAMAEEGIGPVGDSPADAAVGAWAVATVRADPGRYVTDHEMYDHGLLSDAEHDVCVWCAYRIGHTITIARPAGGWAACTASCSCGWADPDAPAAWDESVAHLNRHLADAVAAARNTS